MSNKLKYHCIFGGGGIRGISYIGALRALSEKNIEIESIAGSSVGAIFSALYAVGYTENEIKEKMNEFNITMFRDLNIDLFSHDVSISKGEIFLDWLREKIEKKYYAASYKKGDNKPVTFEDLDINLQILTVDINTNTPFIFSKETTPNTEIAFALRASASLPGLMKPVSYNNAVLVDGDLSKTLPAWKIFNNIDNENSRILEFRLEGARTNSEFKNPQDYINSVIDAISYISTENITDMYQKNDRYDYIVIDTKDIILFDFNLDTNKKNELIEKGYNITKNYLDNILVSKKKMILDIYKKLLIKTKELIKNIKKGNAETSVNIINDILSDITENKKYTDISFYNDIYNLKKEITANIKWAFIHKKIDNNNSVTAKAEKIKTLMEYRIEDLLMYIK